MKNWYPNLIGSKRKLLLVIGLAMVIIGGVIAWINYVVSVADIDAPSREAPKPNGYDFYIQAGAKHVPASSPVDVLQDVHKVPQSKWKTVYPTAKKEAWIRANANSLKLIAQAQKYSCLVPRSADHTNKPLGPYRKFRELARMLSVKCHAEGERRRWDDAAMTCLSIFKLGYDIQRGGVMVDGLVGYAILGQARREAWDILPHLSAAQSKRFTRELEKLHRTRESFSQILLAEKLGGVAGFKRTMGNNKLLLIPRRFVINNYVGYMDQLAQSAEKAYPLQNKPSVPVDPYCKILAPVFENSVYNVLRSDTGTILLLTAAALRAHKMENEKHPAHLNELVPSYLKAVPVDPYTNKRAVAYKPLKKNSYLLYSVGPDGVDNGGRPIENKKKKGRARHLVWDGKNDFVAGINY